MTSRDQSNIAPIRLSCSRMCSMFSHRPLQRVDAALDRGVLGRQAEGVEAHREEHVVAVHAR